MITAYMQKTGTNELQVWPCYQLPVYSQVNYESDFHT